MKKNFEKNPSRLFVHKDQQNGVRKFFQNKWVSRHFILLFQKTVLHYKVINKTRSTKNQENSAHRSEENYLTNHLVKFQQDRIKQSLKSWSS